MASQIDTIESRLTTIFSKNDIDLSLINEFKNLLFDNFKCLINDCFENPLKKEELLCVGKIRDAGNCKSKRTAGGGSLYCTKHQNKINSITGGGIPDDIPTCSALKKDGTVCTMSNKNLIIPEGSKKHYCIRHLKNWKIFESRDDDTTTNASNDDDLKKIEQIANNMTTEQYEEASELCEKESSSNNITISTISDKDMKNATKIFNSSTKKQSPVVVVPPVTYLDTQRKKLINSNMSKEDDIKVISRHVINEDKRKTDQ